MTYYLEFYSFDDLDHILSSWWCQKKMKARGCKYAEKVVFFFNAKQTPLTQLLKPHAFYYLQKCPDLYDTGRMCLV